MHTLAAIVLLAATQGGPIPLPLPLFPPNNWWNIDISAAPVDPGSNGYITSSHIGATKQVHPDFGGDAGDGEIYGIPFIQVDGSQPKVEVDFVAYPSQSDGVGVPFYPIPAEAITTSGWVEGGPPGNVDVDGDRHILVVDTTNNHLYELFDVWYNGSQWEAGSGAFFDMNTNNRRPETWTSADAAGLAILPGLVRYDEVYGPDEIRHAFRVTVGPTNGYVYPASHEAGDSAGALPMGARLRLKASKDISTYPPEIQKIFRAFKKYGLIVADNGSDMYVSGAYDTRWDNDILNPAFHSLKAEDFEVVQLGWKPPFTVVISTPPIAGAGDPANVSVTVYDQNYSVATGYTGTIAFDSTDPAATEPVAYTFTPGDAGSRSFPSSLVFRTAGSHVVYATDVANATITGSAGVTVGPGTPANLIATGSTNSIAVSWTASPGAVQYEIFRASSAATYSLLGSTTFTSQNDPVSPNTAHAYKVRAVDAASRRSPLSAPDAAVARLFTDDALASGTIIKALHVDELRLATDALRFAAGLGNGVFTDVTLGGVFVKALHITQLRAAMDEARAALGLTAHAPESVTPAAPIRASHINDLRSGVK